MGNEKDELSSWEDAQERYNNSELGKATQKRYSSSTKGIEAKKRYHESEKGTIARLRYYLSEKGIKTRNNQNELQKLFRQAGKWMKENPDKTIVDFLEGINKDD